MMRSNSILKQYRRNLSDYRNTIGKANPDDVKFTFTQDQFKSHKCDIPDLETTCGKDDMLFYFEQMAYIRRMELICDQYYKGKQIFGFCHLFVNFFSVFMYLSAQILFDTDFDIIYNYLISLLHNIVLQLG